MDILHIKQLLYNQRFLFSVLELDARYNWWVIAPSSHGSVFPISHLCILTHITWKLQIIYGCSAYRTTALLSKTFLVWFGVAWEIWLESYDPRHAHRLFSDTNCVHILQACTYIAIWYATTHDNKTHVPYDCILHTKWWLYCQKCIVL